MEKEQVVRVAFVGAGEVNFGSDSVEVPWNHARVLARLGTTPGVKVRAVGVADINVARADAVAAKWRAKSPQVFGDMKAYGGVRSMLDDARPDGVIVGLPPFAHGLAEECDCELECARRGVHLFVEKPISSHPPERVAPVRDELARLVRERGLVVSVGYMFRYSTPVLKLRQLLAEHAVAQGSRAPAVRAIMLRYNTAYPAIEKAMWCAPLPMLVGIWILTVKLRVNVRWDLRLSGGPIIEQCTHFADLARFIAGEVDLSTVSAVAINAPRSDADAHGPGHLSSLPKDVISGKCVEEGVPHEFRVPRVTTAHWRFESGECLSSSPVQFTMGRCC